MHAINTENIEGNIRKNSVVNVWPFSHTHIYCCNAHIRNFTALAGHYEPKQGSPSRKMFPSFRKLQIPHSPLSVMFEKQGPYQKFVNCKRV